MILVDFERTTITYQFAKCRFLQELAVKHWMKMKPSYQRQKDSSRGT